MCEEGLSFHSMASEGPISAALRVLSRRVLGSFRKRDEKRGKSQTQRGSSKVSQKVPPRTLREYLDEREKKDSEWWRGGREPY